MSSLKSSENVMFVAVQRASFLHAQEPVKGYADNKGIKPFTQTQNWTLPGGAVTLT